MQAETGNSGIYHRINHIGSAKNPLGLIFESKQPEHGWKREMIPVEAESLDWFYSVDFGDYIDGRWEQSLGVRLEELDPYDYVLQINNSREGLSLVLGEEGYVDGVSKSVLVPEYGCIVVVDWSLDETTDSGMSWSHYVISDGTPKAGLDAASELEMGLRDSEGAGVFELDHRSLYYLWIKGVFLEDKVVFSSHSEPEFLDCFVDLTRRVRLSKIIDMIFNGNLSYEDVGKIYYGLVGA